MAKSSTGGHGGRGWSFVGVPAGTILGFLGPNGSGKSTTIGCITVLVTPDDRLIEILGQAITDDNVSLKQRVGVMPETLGLFEHLYAHEYLTFVARMFGVEESIARRRVVDLLAALYLIDASKRISEYSAGMRKRIAFAAAAFTLPRFSFWTNHSSRSTRWRSVNERLVSKVRRTRAHRLHRQPCDGDCRTNLRRSCDRGAVWQTGLARKRLSPRGQGDDSFTVVRNSVP